MEHDPCSIARRVYHKRYIYPDAVQCAHGSQADIYGNFLGNQGCVAPLSDSGFFVLEILFWICVVFGGWVTPTNWVLKRLSDQVTKGMIFFGEWIKWVSFWGFHPKTMCLWWFLFPEGSTQIFFIFWIWPSIATCMPVHSWSTRMTIHSSKGGAGMRDSKRYIACMSNGVQTTESHLNVENHGTDGLQIFKGFH